jgi:hypothetical protein
VHEVIQAKETRQVSGVTPPAVGSGQAPKVTSVVLASLSFSSPLLLSIELSRYHLGQLRHSQER